MQMESTMNTTTNKIIGFFNKYRHLARPRKAHSAVLLILPLLLITSTLACAAPQGGVVVGGSAQISMPDDLTTQITQTTDKGIINWTRFDIDVDELVKFEQPGADSVTLNKVTSADPSEILGQMQANGKVFLSNPNGIVFGANSRVDVGSLTATTFDIKNEDFMAGKYEFNQRLNKELAAIVNKGEIRVSDNGFVMLVAPGVKNEGLVVAKAGKVVMGSGEKFTMDFRGDNLISYEVSGEVAEKVTNPNGETLDAAVSNTGTISAQGGDVLLTGDAAREIVSAVVNQEGVIEAQSLVSQGGKVKLIGRGDGIVQNTGKIDVSAAEAGAQSGEVSISGQYAGNFGEIKARGADGATGGSVTLNSTKQTLLNTDGIIDASGVGNSDGGVIKLLSDGNTTSNGSLIARGGELGGNGGFVEISSQGGLVYTGVVDTFAPVGTTGQLLIDPKNVIIAAAGPGTLAGVDQFADTPIADVTIAAATINAAVADVTIQANTDITVNSAVSIAAAGVGLTLQGGRSVLINQNITTNNGDVSIKANDEAGQFINRDVGAGSISMASAAVINAGTANVDMTIGTLSTAGGISISTINTSGNVTLSSAGNITATNANNGTADITAGTLGMTVTGAGNTIGVAGTAIEFNATTLNAATSNGDMVLTDTFGGIALNTVNAGTGDITLTSAGAITAANANDGAADVTAGILDMNVTGASTMIGVDGNAVEFDAATINAATINGSMVLKDTAGGVKVGTINAGNATVLLDAKDGAMTADAATSLTAGTVNLTTTNSSSDQATIALTDSSIGTAANPIKTTVGILSATTINGDIYIQETDGLLVNSVTGKEEGITPVYDGGTDVELGLGGPNGTRDVSITAGGDVVVESVTAPDAVTITTSAGNILDNNQASMNVLAQSVTYNASGAVGQSTDPLENYTENVSGATTNGGFYVSQGFGGTVGAVTGITAGGGNNVEITNTSNALSLYAISAVGGSVTIKNNSGAITDSNGATTNITADSASITSTGGINIDTDVAAITTKTTDASAATDIDEANALTSISAETKGGNVNVDFNGGDALAFTGSSGLINLTGGVPLTFNNTGGGIQINTINAGAGAVSLTAIGSITDDVNDAATDITAGAVTMSAGGAIGAAGNELDTTVTSLNATANAGGVYIRQPIAIATDMTLTAQATGVGNDIDVANAAGDLTVMSVTAPDQVTINAAGSILAGDPAQVAITGASAILTSGGAIGTVAVPLNTMLSTLQASANTTLGIANRKALTVTSGTATTGDMKITASGDLTIDTLTANGTVTINASGQLIDSSGGASTNITADTADITARQIGALGSPIKTLVNTLSAVTTSGGIFINETNAGTLALNTVTAVGSNADVEITTAGNITLGAITSQGDDITLTTSAGQITDGNAADNNVSGKTLTITATNGIGTVADALEVAVDEISANGGAGSVYFVNSTPLTLSETSLESGNGSYEALSITILNIPDNVATIPAGTTLVLHTSTGDIVFLDQNDTLSVSAGANIDIDAGTTAGSGAVAVLGNLESNNGNITVGADSNITIGLADAGTGDVSIISRNGVIVDGNGASVNVIGTNVTIGGTMQTAEDADVLMIQSVSEAAALESERDTKELIMDMANSTAAAYDSLVSTKQTALDIATLDVANKQTIYDNLQSAADDAQLAADIASSISTGLGAAATAADLVAGGAQAVPLTGDGGAAAIAAGLGVAADAAAIASEIANWVASDAQNSADNAKSELVAAQALLTSLTEDLATAQALADAATENASLASLAYDAAVVEADRANMVADQTIIAAAEATSPVVGGPDQSFGVTATNLTVDAHNSDVYLELTGDTNLQDITTDGDISNIYLKTPASLTVAGDITSTTMVSLETGVSIVDGGGLITSPTLVTTAGTDVGSLANPIDTDVDSLAGNVTGNIYIDNDGVLAFTTVDPTVGLTAGGDIDIISDTINIQGTDITQSGAGYIKLTGDLILLADTTLTTTTGDVTVDGTINSNTDETYQLTTTTAGGDVTVTGVIGGVDELTNLTVTGNDISLNDIGAAAAGVTGATTITAADAGDTGSITFTGATYNAMQQTYNAGAAANAILINGGAATTFTSADQAIAYTGAVDLNGNDLTVTAGAGAVTFANTVDGAGNLQLSTTGAGTFGGAVGGGTALITLTTDAGGATAINGGAVTTTGAQTYNDDVTLGAATTLTAGGTSDITFAATLNGAQTLALNTAGSNVFNGIVGGTTALTSITTDAAGGTTINTTNITTTGAQTYNDAVSLTSDTTLASGGSDLVFNNTLNGAQALILNTAGNNIFTAVVGGGTALTSITTNAGGATAINGGAVTTTGAQTYNDAVTLGAATTLTSTGGGNLAFGSTLNGAQTLALNTAGNNVFNGIVGGGTALTSITTDDDGAGVTVINTTGVKTSGFQEYNDAVSLTSDSTLESTGGGAITFNNTLDSLDGTQDLVLNTAGDTTFNDLVGMTTALASITTDDNGPGVTVINTTGVKTTGFQEYNDVVTLTSDTTLTSTTAGDITFNNTLDGPFDLVLTTDGENIFNALVGSLDPLTTLTTTANGGTTINTLGITTTGNQTYNDVVTLTSDTTLTSTTAGDITFNNTLDGAFDLVLTTDGENIFNALVGSLDPLTTLTTTANGGTTIHTTGITTTGDQEYNDVVTLTSNTTLTADTGDITFNNTLDGAFDLVLTTDGENIFNALVGSLDPLTTLTTTANGGTTIHTTGITTTGDQEYNDVVTLTSNTELTSTTSGDITFNNTLDGAFDLVLTTDGENSFNALVGSLDPLTTLTTTANGGTTIHTTGITTTGDQEYNDVVTLTSNTELTSTTAGDITFNNTLDGAFDMVLTTDGENIFNALVGSLDPLTTLTTTANGGTTIHTTGITTTGDQEYNDVVTLTSNTTLTADTGDITFNNTLDGAFDLVLTTDGENIFNALVGSLDPLTTLTTTANGGTTIHTTGITTTGDQEYNDVVTLTSNTELTSTTSGDITFNNTLDGAFDLVLTTDGENIFNALVGSLDPLTTLTTTANGGTTIHTTGITTTGDQEYNDVVTLTSNTELTSTTSGDITFNNTLDGAFDLVLTTDGENIFNALVGSLDPLTTLTTTANGGTTIHTTGITTTGNQEYNDVVTLTSNTTLTADTGDITFNNTLDGAFDLVLTTDGENIFNALVGSLDPLTTLTTTANGGTTIHTTGITTTGDQEYNDVVTLTSNTTLTSTTSGDITFNNTLDGAFDLVLTTDGENIFNALVGSLDPLTTLTTTANGGTTIHTTGITTTGDQEYNDVVTLTSNTTLTADTGDITFNNTLDGAFDLVLTTDGENIFNALVGSLDPLTTLTTTANGGTTIHTTGITTTGDQEYNDVVTLTSNTTLTADTGDITFNNTLDGAFDLVLTTDGENIFNALVGSLDPLTTLTTTANGGTTIHTTGITTTGDQEYNDVVTLTSNTELTSTTSGDITFNNTLDGAFDLVLTTDGENIFNALVGSLDPLTTLTTTANGGTTIHTTGITTTGDQEYNDVVTLTSNTELTSTTSGDITFNNTLDGAFDLVLTTDGENIFNALVGSLDPLTTLTTTANGGTTIHTTGITTTGDQEYNDVVTLTSNTELTSTTSGDITFNNTLDGAFDLVLTTDGENIFNALVGSLDPLTTLTTTANGGTTIHTTGITTTGDQEYNDVVTLTSNTELTSTTSGDITFNNTLDGAFDLVLTTDGENIFNALVGSLDPLTTLTTTANGGTTIHTLGITTTGDQTYNDVVTLTSNTTLTADTGDITFNNTLDGAFDLVLTTDGENIFNALVGSLDPLTTLTTTANGGTTIHTTGITTTGDQEYNDVVTLTSNTTLTSTTSGDITFNETVDGAQILNLNTAGDTVFNAVVGGVTPVTAIVTDADGGTTINTTNITTVGGQTYFDPVTLTSDTTLASTGSGNVKFDTTLDGAHNLVLNTAGQNVFNGVVGGVDPLTTITTDAAGRTTINTTDVTTTGAQTYNDQVVLTSDTTLTSTGGGDLTFNGKINGTRNLTLDTSGNNVFNSIVGDVFALAAITTDAPGGTIINTTAITTSGAQTYNDPVTLTSDAILASTGAGNLTFNNTVNGAQNLVLNSAGNSVFNAIVGGGTALTSITTDVAGGTTINTTAVTTSGAQTYNDPVTLISNTTLASTGAGDLTFNNSLNGMKNLVLNTSGNNVFNGVVGGSTALTSITTNAAGGTTINTTSMTTSGAQTYNDAVTLTSDTILTSSGAADLTFNNTVNGAQKLTLNTAGDSVFNAIVGGVTPVTAIVTDAAGGTTINTTAVTTAGGQTYNDVVTLTSDTTLASTGAGNLTFNGTLNGAQNLTLNTSGKNNFNSVVGDVAEPLSITTDAAGGTTINTTSIKTSGAQTYNDAVTLTSDTTLASSGGGDLTFNNKVNGTRNLTLNTAGDNVFNAVVGDVYALTTITTDAPGGTVINTTSIKTSDMQTYNDAVTLTSDTTLASTGAGDLTFNGTLNGAKNLALNTAGDTVFNGVAGGVTALSTITTDAAGGTTFNSSAITTSGAQTYNDPITLTANTTLADTGAGDVTFNNTINGANTLTVNTAGTTTFNQAIGGTTALAGITTDAPGVSLINGGSVSTTGAQAINDPLTLGADTTFTASAGNIGFGNTINGAYTMNVTTPSNAVFSGVIGGATPLATVNVTAGGDVAMQVNVTGAVNVNTASANGDIDLSSTTGDLLIGTLTAGQGTVGMTSVASITDTNGAATNIVAQGAAFTAATGIGAAADPMEITVSNLAATTVTGGIYIVNTGSLNITTVNGVSGISVTSPSAVDHIDVSTTVDMVISQPVTQAGSGDITLAAGNNVTLDNDVTANGGTITILAGNSVYQNGDVTNTGDGDVNITAVEGDIVMDQDAQTNVDDGTAGYTADDNIVLGGIDAGGVDIASNNGQILDGNGDAPNISSNDLDVDTPTGEAAGANNSDFLFAFSSESGGLPELLIINNRILGGVVIEEFYQAISAGNSSLTLGDMIMYNTLFDNAWRGAISPDMMAPWVDAQTPLPTLAGFTF